mmetsp:Transcript_14795/g.43616  ORF Transcript_14795/g.43616 Transcript_14795/m.43616 type:complete len:209 (-) Transcript_14795:1790-2416(-)
MATAGAAKRGSEPGCAVLGDVPHLDARVGSSREKQRRGASSSGRTGAGAGAGAGGGPPRHHLERRNGALVRAPVVRLDDGRRLVEPRHIHEARDVPRLDAAGGVAGEEQGVGRVGGQRNEALALVASVLLPHRLAVLGVPKPQPAVGTARAQRLRALPEEEEPPHRALAHAPRLVLSGRRGRRRGQRVPHNARVQIPEEHNAIVAPGG